MKESDRDMSRQKRRKRLALILSLAIGILAIAWLAAVMYYTGMDIVLNPKIARSIARNSSNPAIRERFDDWSTRPLTFPPEALKAEPLSEDLIEASQEALDKYDALSSDLKELLRGDKSHPALSETPRAIIEDYYDQLQPAIAAFERFVNRPDFDTGATAGNGAANYLFFQSMARALKLKVYALNLEGRDGEAALKAGEAALRAAKVDPFASIINTLVAVAVAAIGIEAWQLAVENCDDPALLRETLKRQNELVAELPNFPPGIPIEVIEYFFTFRQAQRQRPDMELHIQGRTGRELFAEMFRVQLALKLAKPKSRNKRIMRILAGDFPIPVPKALGEQVAFHYYIQALPSDLEARTRCAVVRAKFDILRVMTASRICELETGTAPDSVEELVPDYLPEAPVDVFSPDSMLIHNDPLVGSYSVGPDREDNRGMILYDSTNGTLSAGDVLER